MSQFVKCVYPVGMYSCFMRTTLRFLSGSSIAQNRNFKTCARMTGDLSIQKRKLSEHSRSDTTEEPGKQKTKKIAFYAIFITTCCFGYHAFVHFTSKSSKKVTKQTKTIRKYNADDVKSHNSKQSGVWVASLYAVYDITEYVETHPGGGIILEAAGGSLEPFWEKYPVHEKKEIEEILDQYKIGVIPAEESKLLVRHTIQKMEELQEKKTLRLEPNDYKLHLEGVDMACLSLTIKDIKTKFQKHNLEADLKCSAKKELKAEKPIWSGALLKDVLESGTKVSNPQLYFVHFIGLDGGFAVSVPLDTVLKEEVKVLLAYEMNGRELQPKQGYPIRVIVPMDTGYRSVKWLGKVILNKERQVNLS